MHGSIPMSALWLMTHWWITMPMIVIVLGGMMYLIYTLVKDI